MARNIAWIIFVFTFGWLAVIAWVAIQSRDVPSIVGAIALLILSAVFLRLCFQKTTAPDGER